MRIIQLVTQMEFGGAQRIAFLLHEALQRRGHDTEIWFLYRKRPSYDHAGKVRVLSESKPSLRRLPRLLSTLQAELDRHSPDVLITHTYYANVLGQLYARFLGIKKRIAVQHGLASDYPLLVRLLDYIIGSTDTYTTNVAISQVVESSFSKYPASYLKRLRTIPNGVPCVAPTSSRKETRSAFGLPLHRPLMANVGRLSTIKNQTVLLDVLAHLPKFHLVLIGDGELRTELTERAARLRVADRLHIVGEIVHQNVVNLVSASDVFVFPSRSESMGLAAIEAMMCGTPIVASYLPALREVLGSDSAIYVARNDVAGLAEAIRHIVTNPEFAEKISAKSRDNATRFTLERMVSEYEQVLTVFD